MTGKFHFLSWFTEFSPDDYQPEHACPPSSHSHGANENKRFSKLQQLLFLPGMPGSVLFTLLLCALAAIAVYLIDRMASIPEFQSPQRLFCLAAGGWYAITMPAMLLKPFWEKLKNNTLLTYTMICLILCLVQNVLWGVNLSVPFSRRVFI